MKNNAELLRAISKKISDNIGKFKMIGGLPDQKQIGEAVSTIVKVARASSNRTKYDKSIGNYQLTDYKVSKYFKDLFLPCEITIDSTYFAADVADKGNLAEKTVPTPGQFSEAQAYLLMLFKKNLGGESEDAESLTAPIDLVQAMPRTVSNEKVNEAAEGIPLFVKVTGIYKDTYFNLSVDEFLDRWFHDVFIPTLRERV